MSDLFWLTRAQLKRIEPHFPLSHGVPRVDNLRVISGIIHVIRNGLRWRDAPKDTAWSSGGSVAAACFLSPLWLIGLGSRALVED